jgi:hypothetical protein
MHGSEVCSWLALKGGSGSRQTGFVACSWPICLLSRNMTCLLHLPLHVLRVMLAAYCLGSAPTYDTSATSAATQQQLQQQNSGATADCHVSSGSDRAWRELQVPAGLGLASTRFKWRQNLSHVEVFVRLPDTVQPKQVGILVMICDSV